MCIRDRSLTCINCHDNNADLQVSLDIDVLDANNESVASSGYTPGETYTVKVLINPVVGTPAGHGFQLSCLNAPEGQNGSEVATWTDIADNVKISTAAANNRTYAEHDGVSTSNEFLVQWTAPSAGAGSVTFYSCGNGVNGNQETGGDGAACSTLTLMEAGVVNSTKDLDQTNLGLVVNPNPIVDRAAIEIKNGKGDFDINIINLSGQIVYETQVVALNAWEKHSLSLDHLVPGVYFMHLTNGEQSTTQKIVKQ